MKTCRRLRLAACCLLSRFRLAGSALCCCWSPVILVLLGGAGGGAVVGAVQLVQPRRCSCAFAVWTVWFVWSVRWLLVAACFLLPSVGCLLAPSWATLSLLGFSLSCFGLPGLCPTPVFPRPRVCAPCCLAVFCCTPFTLCACSCGCCPPVLPGLWLWGCPSPCCCCVEWLSCSVPWVGRVGCRRCGFGVSVVWWLLFFGAPACFRVSSTTCHLGRCATLSLWHP